MKFKLLLSVVAFIPAMVMAQQKPATSPVVEKPIAVNPPLMPATERAAAPIVTKNAYSTRAITGNNLGEILGGHTRKSITTLQQQSQKLPAPTPQKQMVGASASVGPVASPDDGPKIEEIN